MLRSRFLVPFLAGSLVSVAGACTLGCASSASESSGQASSSVTGNLVVSCSAMTVDRGSIGGGQSYKALAVSDQTGSADDWNKYVELSPATSVTCTYALPAGTASSSVSALSLRTNYRGASKSAQLWTFEAWDAVAGAWVLVGDNGFASEWAWTRATLPFPGGASRFFAGGKLKVRYGTPSSADASDLDELVVLVTSGSSGGSVADAGAPPPQDAGSTPPPQDAGPRTTTDAGSSSCNSIWAPAPGASWLWDLDDATVPVPAVSSSHVSGYDASVYDVDMFNTTSGQIGTYHAAGKKVVCYVDVGSWESGRPDSNAFDAACYSGASHKMQGWPEYWLDIKNDSCSANVKSVIGARFALAAQKGCDAIEPDNVDSYANNAGWGATMADQTAYNVWLAQAAHASCLGIALKNAGDMLVDNTAGPALVKAFDFSLNEQCHQYGECSKYQGFTSAGKAAFNAEYPGSTAVPSYCGTPGMKTLQYDSMSVAYGNLLSVCP